MRINVEPIFKLALESACLVFGVDNKSRTIVDSDYRRDRARLDG